MSTATATYGDLALDIVRMIKVFELRNVVNYNTEIEHYIKDGYIHLRHNSHGVCSLFLAPHFVRRSEAHHLNDSESLAPHPINDEDGDCICERIHDTAIYIDIDIAIDIYIDIDDDDDDEDGLSYEEECLLALIYAAERRMSEAHKYWDDIAESIEKFLEENQVQKIKYSDYFDLGIAEHPEYFTHRIKKQDISRHK